MKNAQDAATHPRAPTHPGALFRDVVLPSTGWTVIDAARKLGVSRQSLHAVMSGRSRVTAAMALRLGKLCGNGPSLWLHMQTAFDLWEAEMYIGDALDSIPHLAINSRGLLKG